MESTLKKVWSWLQATQRILFWEVKKCLPFHHRLTMLKLLLIIPAKLRYSTTISPLSAPPWWLRWNLKVNYRPISLLPILGKIFEKVLFDSPYDYIINNKLTSCQSGFIKGDSCVNQLLAISQEIHKYLDVNPSIDTIDVFLDMSKAFDKVWRNGLICKLQSYGIIISSEKLSFQQEAKSYFKWCNIFLETN